MSLEMESKRCMNNSCPTSKSIQWRKGWTLQSGVSALLCDTCGSAYEEAKFCDLFHKKQDGWRHCCLCEKNLHCGCIVSRPFIVLQDFGGVSCTTCSKKSGQLPEEMTCNKNLISDTPPSDADVAEPRPMQEEIRQQTSGVPNSTIVPLFEKNLTQSDVCRRVIIPKKHAEAYFPPISQAERINLPIHDEEGTNQVFTFKYYTSNNIKMYVLEGVTHWIKSKQLQAGDTITFSRMDPEKKYIMGYRKTSISSTQDSPKLDINLEEAQQLLLPSVQPNIVVIDHHEFEEYDQPPILGKKSKLV